MAVLFCNSSWYLQYSTQSSLPYLKTGSASEKSYFHLLSDAQKVESVLVRFIFCFLNCGIR